MSLPERIRVYLLVDQKKQAIVFATHDAELAALVKAAHQEHSGPVDIIQVVSTRRPNATGETEHRCFGCPTPHTVHVEATSEWTSRMFETPCDGAIRRAQEFGRALDWRLN